MPTFVTRRTALGVATAAALASLTACASDIRPLEDPSVVDPMRPYKGDLKFNSYKSTGTYRPASTTKKAENPPMPVPPENIKSKTISGMLCGAGLLARSPELSDGYRRRCPVQGRGPRRYLRTEDEDIRRLVREG